MAVTTKQKAWLAAYLGAARLNATEAARVAGYKDPEQAGYENKQKPEIRDAIAEHFERADMLKAARWLLDRQLENKG